MAKPITERVKIVGNKLSVEDCDGNIVTYDIPCTCDQGNPDPPSVPEDSLCVVANALAISMFNIACSLQQFVTGQPDNPSGYFISASQWIAAEHFSADRIALAYALIATNRDAIVNGYDLASFTNPSPADGLAAEFICIAYAGLLVTNGAVNQDWLSYVITAMQTHPVETFATGPGWQALAAMMTIPGLGQWQTWAVTVTGSQGTPPFYCAVWFEGICEDCGDLPGPGCETGDPIIAAWMLIGSTPSEWSTLGTIDKSTWAGDTTDIINGDYSGATRIANQDWQKSTAPNNAPPDDNTKIGIKYTFEDPTGVAHIKWTLKANGSFTKIMHVAVKLEDNSMLVVDAFKDPFPTTTEITRDVLFDCVVVKEVWFIGVTGTHNLNQFVYISQTTEIN